MDAEEKRELRKQRLSLPIWQENKRTNTDAREFGANPKDVVATIEDGPLKGLLVGLTQDGPNLMERTAAKREGRTPVPEHWKYWAHHPTDTRLQLGETRIDKESGKEIGYDSRVKAEDALLDALEGKMSRNQ